MQSNAIVFGWTRAIPGRESVSAEHFQEFVAYLQGLQKKGEIENFEPIFMDTHGGDLNGFFLIRADTARIDALASSKEWIAHMTRADLHLQGSGAVRACVGDGVMTRMELWKSMIP